MSDTENRFYGGVLAALAVVGHFDSMTIYEEIVGTVGARDLLREAIRQQDMELPRLRKVIREIRRKERLFDVVAPPVRFGPPSVIVPPPGLRGTAPTPPETE